MSPSRWRQAYTGADDDSPYFVPLATPLLLDAISHLLMCQRKWKSENVIMVATMLVRKAFCFRPWISTGERGRFASRCHRWLPKSQNSTKRHPLYHRIGYRGIAIVHRYHHAACTRYESLHSSPFRAMLILICPEAGLVDVRWVSIASVFPGS